MFLYEGSKTLSVRPYPEKINRPDFVSISPTLVVDTSMERSSEYYSIETQKIYFFSVKFELEFCSYPECPYPEKRNHAGLNNIDTSIEKSSRVLQHGNPQI